MANRKYDYSEDVRQPAESASEMAKTSETEEATAVSAEEARRQRLEQRNDALANEFRRLKPEIAEAYRLLNKLIEGIGAYAGTMINLHDLLKTSFPIRFTENDIQALLDEINAIADNAISQRKGGQGHPPQREPHIHNAGDILVHDCIAADTCHILCPRHFRKHETDSFRGTDTNFSCIFRAYSFDNRYHSIYLQEEVIYAAQW